MDDNQTYELRRTNYIEQLKRLIFEELLNKKVFATITIKVEGGHIPQYWVEYSKKAPMKPKESSMKY